PSGNRRDQVETHGNEFFFEQPEDMSNFVYSDLKLAREIKIGNTLYVERFPEVHGNVIYIPDRPGLGDVVGTIKEYSGQIVDVSEESEPMFPDLVVFEQGSADCADGGLMYLYKGWTIFPKNG